MILILTEKPSVAGEFATFLGAEKKDGYFENTSGSNYLGEPVRITYAFGHLLQISNEIPKPWTKEMLPLFPQFTYHSPQASTSKQLKVIKDLVPTATKVIIATDCGREGELIARLILNHCKYDYKNCFRFWTSESLTDPVFKKSLSNLKPSSHYDNLYQSSIARQHSDWIVGINLSVITCLQGNDNYSVGRVQTPTLKLIIDRQNEIKNFVKSFYYQIRGTFDQDGSTYFGLLQYEDKLEPTKEQAQQLANQINLLEGFSIVKKEVKLEKENPPVLHSLTTLQQEANKLYGISAAKTLELAQELYEKEKVISYPRTDSNHMSESSVDMVTDIVNELSLQIDIQPSSAGKRVFDDSKLTDHYALIPLKKYSGDSEKAKIYALILRRFHGVFLNPLEREKTEIYTKKDKYLFKSTGSKILKEGWKKLYGKETFEEEETNSDEQGGLSALNEGSVNKLNMEMLEKERQPKKSYNEASLLKDMQKLNLGTPATRADIIEKLILRQYIDRKGKNLIETVKGDQLINLVRERDFANPEMTAEWENLFSEMEKGKVTYDKFMSDIKNFTQKELEIMKTMEFHQIVRLPKKMIDFAKSISKSKGVKLNLDSINSFEDLKKFIEDNKDKSIGNCLCGAEINDSLKAYSCKNESCKRIVWKQTFGYNIKPQEAIKLLSGEQVLFKNLKKKSGEKFEAKLMIGEDGKITFAPRN